MIQLKGTVPVSFDSQANSGGLAIGNCEVLKKKSSDRQWSGSINFLFFCKSAIAYFGYASGDNLPAVLGILYIIFPAANNTLKAAKFQKYWLLRVRKFQFLGGNIRSEFEHWRFRCYLSWSLEIQF